MVGVTDNKPLEIRDGSISGEKIGDISLRYENMVYTVNQILGMNISFTKSNNVTITKSPILGNSNEFENLVTQAEYDRLKCDVNSLKIKMNKLLEQ